MCIKCGDKVGRNLPVVCLNLAGGVGHHAAACAPHTAGAVEPAGSPVAEPLAGASTAVKGKGEEISDGVKTAGRHC